MSSYLKELIKDENLLRQFIEEYYENIKLLNVKRNKYQSMPISIEAYLKTKSKFVFGDCKNE